MGFKPITGRDRQGAEPFIHVGRQALTLSIGARRLLPPGCERLAILVDSERRLVALKPDLNGRLRTGQRGEQVGWPVNDLLKSLIGQRLPCRLEDGMLVAECGKSETATANDHRRSHRDERNPL